MRIAAYLGKDISRPRARCKFAAIDALLAQFDPLRVAIYLRCFNQIDETHWKALEELIEADDRLALRVPATR